MKPMMAQSAARGVVWSVGGQGAIVVIQIITFSVLARLITPEDFGLVAMVMAIVGIGEILRDFGLTSAAIQAPTLSREEQNSLFWVNLLIGSVLALILWLSAEAIADFYSNSQLISVTHVLALTFVINGLATQPRATLIRDLRAKDLAIADTTSVIIGMIMGISIAVMGYNYWAVVAMQLSRLGMMALLAIVFARFVPKLPNRHVSIRHFMHFGLGLFGTQIMVMLGAHAPSILIGRILGPVPLGFFSRAQNLANIPLASLAPALHRIALPVLSRLQHDYVRYDSFLIRGQTALMFISVMGYAVLFVYADIVVLIFLGSVWEDATTPLRILCVAAASDTMHYFLDWIYVSRGHMSQYFRFSFVARLTLIVAVVLTARLGIEAVGLAIVLSSAMSWPVGLIVAHSVNPLPFKTIVITAVRLYLLGAMAMLAGLGTRFLTRDLRLPVELVLSITAMCAVCVLMAVAIRALRNDITSLWEMIVLIRHNGKSLTPTS